MNNSKISAKIDKFVNETILEENIENIVGDRFGRYSKYVIQDRALPDVRDGLKPVQRRILYALYRLGMFSTKPYKKSARVVGDVIGKFHPHGDTAVYDALIRMSQDFKMLLPLIDVHGNNGSIDGDPPAAMRYTECRMSKYAELLLQDINKRTVGLIPNFDDEELEPIVLPSKFPNILVNGATGISAGYATDIPPHNPDEIIDAVLYRINNPKSTLEDLLKIVKGPDFPTCAIVHGIDGIRSSYETGRGKIIVRAKAEIESTKTEHKIIITEIPYEVNKAILIRKMNDMIIARNVDGVKAIRDETDRQGLRIVIDVRKDANPDYILDFLYKTTELQSNYNFNMVVIHKGRPMQMGLMEIIDAYIGHQKEVITNRSNFELAKAERRAHIVEGLIQMVSILDAVIRTIRNSQNKRDAKENIMINYGFTEIQAEAIVMLQLYRLTNTDIFALRTEANELEQQIKSLKNILSSEKALLKTICEELKATKALISQPRRTQIEEEVSTIKVEQRELISKEDVMLIITHHGYLKRLSKKAYYSTTEPTRLKEGDVIAGIYEVATTDTLLQFTNLGNYVYLPIHKIPEVKHRDFGYHVSTLISMEANEKILYSVPVSEFADDRYILITTKLGLIKRVALSKLDVNRYSKVLKATKLREGDEVVSADCCTGDDYEVVIATKDGYMNRYNSSEISVLEPASFGVKAIELKSRPDDYVVSAKFIKEKDIIILLTNRGNIKRMRPEEITKGKKNHVGKMYLKIVRSNMHEAVTMDVIHHKNANSDLESYIYCENGYVPIDYTILRIAIAENGRKMVPTEKGKPLEIVIQRNNYDIEL
ncbi:MAG TPA: DNA topoisomerase IV subunit A [Bacilli bacterium]|jgi:topoisomerase-4 subunit A|nr:MAG: DNA topoisomerase 4 subunit A [Tenericutes bacterium ADurb.Bin140]HOE77801.1 DNA topoisomerase IV subunit A [Bacilli bacterium]HRU49313.1 DNA topoisomerase IV subunit A [Bacilli bacterium]